ncbi:HAD-IIB family hydrolase [Acidianus manzaensis]|uniref:Phosphoglycolate phosphatase n=1 Tax=Acidianus manzaensis TaxID=282676 RepID=A0A1W6JZ44_9CREN|nr:HAD-IIB family hydrolase [Acidianus manzaensis]ARM75601.1 hypothetical protein B6F84_05810 [Acidianus manzaensis]
MEKILVLSDFDRTLADENDGFVIKKDIVKKINDFIQSHRNILFFVVTGRERKNIRGVKRKSVFELANGLKPTGWILENGSIIIIDNKEYIEVSKDWLSDIQKISEQLTKNGIDHALGETIIFADNTWDKRDLLNKIVSKVSEGRGKIEWNTDDAMILEKNISKGRGIDKLMQLLNCKCIRIGIGDAQNDIPLFENVDIKVAVSNALPEIKKIANIVVNNGPGYGVLELFNLIESNKIQGKISL